MINISSQSNFRFHICIYVSICFYIHNRLYSVKFHSCIHPLTFSECSSKYDIVTLKVEGNCCSFADGIFMYICKREIYFSRILDVSAFLVQVMPWCRWVGSRIPVSMLNKNFDAMRRSNAGVHLLTMIPAWISHHINHKIWDKITYWSLGMDPSFHWPLNLWKVGCL